MISAGLKLDVYFGDALNSGRRMANDARVREDKPVTPAFLFAALLWEPVRRLAQAAIDAGTDPSLAWQNAWASN